MHPDEMFFHLACSVHSKYERPSKFLCYVGHRGGSKMPGTGDAGDSSSQHYTQLDGCSETSIPISKSGLEAESSGSKYPELDNVYTFHETIGHGGFSKVKMAVEIATGNKVAIKIVDKDHVGDELPRINMEIETLKPLCHKHICKLLKVFYSERKIFMVMEYCPTDLYDFIVRRDDNLEEGEARSIFIQLMSAVAYLHAAGIAHRDLKPENVLLDFDNKVKLTDFGLCAVPLKKGINKAILRTMCGSPAYCAPELLRGPPYIGSKVDVWSLGIILFVLLTGQLPFYSKNLRDLYKKIQEVQYVLPEGLSEGSKDLIDKMLQATPANRPSLNMIWSHPWIQEGDLTGFQDQIYLAHEEAAEESPLNESGDPRFHSAPNNVVEYMDSSSKTSMAVQISLPEIVKSEEILKDKSPEPIAKPKYFSWISRGLQWIRKRFTNIQKPFVKKQEDIEQEPRKIDARALCSDKTMTGLNVIDEEFADCILDKIQSALQSLGIPSKRKGGSIVKNGVGSPCSNLKSSPWNLGTSSVSTEKD